MSDLIDLRMKEGWSMRYTNRITGGDNRPRILIEIEMAVEPEDTDLAAVDLLHDFLVDRLTDWFRPGDGLFLVSRVAKEA